MGTPKPQRHKLNNIAPRRCFMCALIHSWKSCASTFYTHCWPFHSKFLVGFLVNELTLRVYHLTCVAVVARSLLGSVAMPNCMSCWFIHTDCVNHQIYDYDCCGDTINSIQFTDAHAHMRARTQSARHTECQAQKYMTNAIVRNQAIQRRKSCNFLLLKNSIVVYEIAVTARVTLISADNEKRISDASI